jgi:hypothetical protein
MLHRMRFPAPVLFGIKRVYTVLARGCSVVTSCDLDDTLHVSLHSRLSQTDRAGMDALSAVQIDLSMGSIPTAASSSSRPAVARSCLDSNPIQMRTRPTARASLAPVRITDCGLLAVVCHQRHFWLLGCVSSLERITDSLLESL